MRRQRALAFGACRWCSRWRAAGDCRAHRAGSRFSARPDDVTDFATLYSQNCAGVPRGERAEWAGDRSRAIPNTRRWWTTRRCANGSRGGMPGTEMPAFAQSAGGMLTDAQINALIAGMRKEWSQAECLCRSSAAAVRARSDRRCAARRASLSGALRFVPRDGRSRQQVTSPDRILRWSAIRRCARIIIAGRPDIGQPDWRHDSPGGKAAAPLSAQDVDRHRYVSRSAAESSGGSGARRLPQFRRGDEHMSDRSDSPRKRARAGHRARRASRPAIATGRRLSRAAGCC